MSPDLDPSLILILNLSCLYPQWLTLEDVPSGRLHLRLERLSPRPTAAELEEVRGAAGARQGRAHPLPVSKSHLRSQESVPVHSPLCVPGAAGEQPDPDPEELRAGGSPAVCLLRARGRSAGENNQLQLYAQ